MDNQVIKGGVGRDASLVKHKQLVPFMQQLKESGQQALATLAQSEEGQ